MLELSSSLFQRLKIKELSGNNDILLFQYGTYDFGDESGKHFELDITRQFINPKDDEPHQLSFSLKYAPDKFVEIENYNCWNTDFENLEDFIAHIKTTDGFKLANELEPKTYEVWFSQV